MTTGAVVKSEEKQGFAEIVNEAVGAQYPPAYVAAMKELLPPEFRNPVDVIALGIRAKKSGLDPFTEIHAWKNERGTLQFQIARDGFIYIAANDPNVESLEFQHVYEGETFSWSKDSDGKILINHNGGLVQGKLLGAYCVAHMAGDLADHMEMRTVDNYSHLMGKANWKYLPEMLITRVIGATVRLVCPDRAGGLYSEADNELAEVALVEEVRVGKARDATQEKVKRLAGHNPTEILVDDVPDPTPTASPEPTPDESPSGDSGELEDRWECEECHKTFTSQQGLAGHMRAHKTPDPTPDSSSKAGPSSESKATDTTSSIDTSGAKEGVEVELPHGYTVYQADGEFAVVDPDGTIMDAAFKTFNDAALAAQNDLYERENAVQTVQNDPATVVKLADVYAWCRTRSVPATAVRDIINDPIYADEFEQFRDDGAESINAFNLDANANATLLELLKERHG